MASEFVKLHIVKHALEYYIKRDGASKGDIIQETNMLNEVKDDIARFKERIGSGCGGGC